MHGGDQRDDPFLVKEGVIGSSPMLGTDNRAYQRPRPDLGEQLLVADPGFEERRHSRQIPSRKVGYELFKR